MLLAAPNIFVPQSPREYAEWEAGIRARRFLGFQGRWNADRSRMKIAEKSRQLGFSWCDAYDTVTETAGTEWPFDCWVTSRDQIQAQLYTEDCQMWAKSLNILATDLGQSILENAETGRHASAQRLKLANGRDIWSLSSNVDAQAGKRGTRKLDEFALNPENRRLFAIARPGITWGGRLVIFSTHRGSHNYFNELIREIREKGNPKHFSLHRVTIEDALRDGLLVKLKQQWARIDPNDERLLMSEDDYLQNERDECADEETWLQEYMCVPADDASAFLEYEQIIKCRYRPEEIWETDLFDAKGELFVGVDIGRKHDLTVIWVLEKLGDTFYTRRVIEMSRQRFDAQEAELYAILALPQVRRCCIDETGIGIQFTERAKIYSGKVEGVTFTPRVKEELAYPLKTAFEEMRVRIPDNKFITTDLRAVKKETTLSGNVRFAADRGVNGHADRFWALALALHAGATLSPAGTFKAFGAKSGRGLTRQEIRHSRRMLG
jgi:phage FluMu gp28-like protein